MDKHNDDSNTYISSGQAETKDAKDYGQNKIKAMGDQTEMLEVSHSPELTAMLVSQCNE